MNKIRKTFFKWRLRWRVKRKDFSIISNNCWGAQAYADAGIPYLTPTVGLFFDADCYLRFVGDLRNNLKLPLTFISRSRHERLNKRRDSDLGKYPIGRLGDFIEIQFLHYRSEDEAREKWTRRTARLATDDRRLFLKFDDFHATDEQLMQFDRIALPNKICLMARHRPEMKSSVLVAQCVEMGKLPNDGNDQYWITQNYFDLADWFNGGTGRSANRGAPAAALV